MKEQITTIKWRISSGEFPYTIQGIVEKLQELEEKIKKENEFKEYKLTLKKTISLLQAIIIETKLQKSGNLEITEIVE